MSTIHPSNTLIRSPHYRALLADGASFIAHQDTVLADNYGSSAIDEATQAKQLGIIDLTPLARTGFKGKQAINWGIHQGLSIGENNNQAYMQENGALVARLADSEILILNSRENKQNQCSSIEQAYANNTPENCYSVPRSDASSWFMISGKHSSELFAKICGIDLRAKSFPNYSIAQTSIARINGIIIRNDVNGTHAFYLLFDSASTNYMWTSLKDAYKEFNGAPVGHSALAIL